MREGDVVADRFEILGAAGSGGMGDVYRALDRATGQTVAVKVLASGFHRDALRFEREAALVSRLAHPSIVRYIHYGIAEARAVFVMEWVDGETLTRRLRQPGLTADESVRMARHVADALGAAHAAGVVHRDIKPSNIVLAGGDPDAAKVIDFGVAVRPHDAIRFTESGTVVGTPGYMSPEQALSSRSVDARSDVFSVGCVLYECLTGVPAFPGRNPLAVRAKVLMMEPAPARELAPELPAELDALLGRMLAKSPEQRPLDGAMLATELAAIPSIESARRMARVDWLPTLVPPSTLAAVDDAPAAIAVTAVMVPSDASAATVDGRALTAVREGIRQIAERYRSTTYAIGEDATLVVSVGGGDPTTVAASAARCALEIRDRFPHTALVMLVGPSAELEPMLDRGARTLEIAVRRRLLTGARADAAPSAIAVDAATAGFLPTPFDVRRVGSKSFHLHGVGRS